jgi:hypothetical protein
MQQVSKSKRLPLMTMPPSAWAASLISEASAALHASRQLLNARGGAAFRPEKRSPFHSLLSSMTRPLVNHQSTSQFFGTFFKGVVTTERLSFLILSHKNYGDLNFSLMIVTFFTIILRYAIIPRNAVTRVGPQWLQKPSTCPPPPCSF